MFTLLFIIATSLAAGPHTGIPVEGIEGLSAPIFQTAKTGWWAQIPRGTVQVYVGTTDVESGEWVASMKEKMAKYKPILNEGYVQTTHAQEAFGDGVGLLIVRDANIAFMVRHDGQAEEWARTIHSSILDIPVPTLPPAGFEKDGDHWIVTTPEGVVHIAFKGGVTTNATTLRFSEPPEYVVIWDGWGRSVISTFDTENQRAAATPIP